MSEFVALPHRRFFMHCLLVINPLLSPAHGRVIQKKFFLAFLCFLFLLRLLRFERAFLTHRQFLPSTPSPYFGTFVTQMRTGSFRLGCSSMPALIELSIAASTWFRTIDVLVTMPLFIKCARESQSTG